MFAGSGFPELSVCEIEQTDDNRNRRPCCYHIGAHHVWGGRLSGRAELRFKAAAIGNQTISAKIRVNNIFCFYCDRINKENSKHNQPDEPDGKNYAVLR